MLSQFSVGTLLVYFHGQVWKCLDYNRVSDWECTPGGWLIGWTLDG